MTGRVDGHGRALLSVSLRLAAPDQQSQFDVWVDTGFNGDLVLSRSMIDQLGLSPGSAGRAVLADGSEVIVTTYLAQLDWFDMRRLVEVVANDGQYPLLGIGMLAGHRLEIDYSIGTVVLE